MDGFAFEDVVAGSGGLGDDGGDRREGGSGGSGFGDGEGVDVLYEAHADGSDAGGGSGEREAGEGRHDEAGGGCWGCGGFDLFGDTDEEADAGALGGGNVGARGLGEDDAGFAG